MISSGVVTHIKLPHSSPWDIDVICGDFSTRLSIDPAEFDRDVKRSARVAEVGFIQLSHPAQLHNAYTAESTQRPPSLREETHHPGNQMGHRDL